MNSLPVSRASSCSATPPAVASSPSPSPGTDPLKFALPGATAAPTGTGAPPVDESLLLTDKKLAVVFGSMLLSILLIALDGTILATALPRIASDFDSFSKQGFVSSAFLLAQCSCVSAAHLYVGNS